MCVYVCVHKFYLFIYREFYSHTRTSRTLASTRESPALVFRGISLIRTPPTSHYCSVFCIFALFIHEMLGHIISPCTVLGIGNSLWPLFDSDDFPHDEHTHNSNSRRPRQRSQRFEIAWNTASRYPCCIRDFRFSAFSNSVRSFSNSVFWPLTELC